MIEVLGCTEAWKDAGDDIEFDYTKVFVRKDGCYYYAHSPERMVDPHDIDNLHLERIPVEELWPPFPPTFTQVPVPVPENTYVKPPAIHCYDDDSTPSKVRALMLQEVEICELLRRKPHPNIALYLGCLVEEGTIRGLCFQRYPVTLKKWLETDPSDADKAVCLQGIRDGIQHMHSLGLVHNDINPSNIMLDGNKAALIDFDSCRRDGEKNGPKTYTPGWGRAADQASFENDLYSLGLVEKLLLKL
ncbi:serine/threonine kinase [Xylariomycetidae sp. FL0641]|nr:serine/threonine kinase [Xylariomycetidae sp. FL0641]